MLNLGTPELLVILLVALIVLGPAKLPEAARKVGQAINELRRMTTGFEAELRDALDVKVDPGSGSRSVAVEPPVTASGEDGAVDSGDPSGAVSADGPRPAGDAGDHSAN